MNRGDIVTLANRTGLWVFAGDSPAESPNAGKFVKATHLDSQNPHEAITIGMASATLVASPQFLPGMTVHFCGGEAEVESDDGESVELTYTRRVPVPPHEYPGEFFSQDGRCFVERAALVRNNIHLFI
jgi:hypothetical protein